MRRFPLFGLLVLVACAAWLLLAAADAAMGQCGPRGCPTGYAPPMRFAPPMARPAMYYPAPERVVYPPPVEHVVSYGSSGSCGSMMTFADAGYRVVETTTTSKSDTNLRAENRQLRDDLEAAVSELEWCRNCNCDCPDCRCRRVRTAAEISAEHAAGDETPAAKGDRRERDTGPAGMTPFELSAYDPRELPAYDPLAPARPERLARR